jgi:hypothetical protein
VKRTIVDEALLDLAPRLALPVSFGDHDKLRRQVWRLRASSASLSVQTRAYERSNSRLAAKQERK